MAVTGKVARLGNLVFVIITLGCATVLIWGICTASFLVAWMAAGLWLLVVAVGVCSLSSGIFLTCYPRKRLPGKIVLTIDDGPDPMLTPCILELLHRHAYCATFFLIGQEAERYPELVDAICRAGHTVASHSYSHKPWLNFCLSAAWQKELTQAAQILGHHLVHRWFRPPFALLSPHLAHAVNRLQYRTILFHVRARDFGNRRVAGLAARLLRKIEPGGVVLLHGSLPVGISQPQVQELRRELDFFFMALADRSLQVVSLEQYLRESTR